MQKLLHHIQAKFPKPIQSADIAYGELTVEIAHAHLRTACQVLRTDPDLQFEQLMDVAGVDYVHYGIDEWQTRAATYLGFDRGVEPHQAVPKWDKPRFAVVYHLLSMTHNRRIRVRVFAEGEPPTVDSVTDIWASADWFEREAFDLYGIYFRGHPDLRRILTDYGFIGHPFRKDFPLIGEVEVRYDETEKRVVYQPVSIDPRVLHPKVIRRDD